MPQLPDHCNVDGKDLDELASAIKDAFDADELDQLVRITFSEGLYQSYVGRDLSGQVLVFKLLEALERRGTCHFPARGSACSTSQARIDRAYRKTLPAVHE